MNEEKSCQSVYHWSLIGREAGAGRNDKLNKTYNRRILFGIYSRKLLASMSSTTHWKMSGHLVSLIKHHGLFAPYIVANFTPNPTFFFTSLTRKSWFTSWHTSLNPRVFFPHTCYSIQWFLHLIISGILNFIRVSHF